MPRLLLTVALVAASCLAGVGAAHAGEGDAERRCELAEGQVSLLSEARLAAVLQAAAPTPRDERCVMLRGARADCQWHDGGLPSGPTTAWSPWSRDHWLPANAVAPRAFTAPAPWRVDVRVVLCDGFARALERPPRG